MPPTLTPLLRALLIEQENVVGLWQLPAAERKAVTRAQRARRYIRLSHHVVFCALGDPPDSALVWAALLHGGPHARLSGRTALVLHGWKGETSAPHDVVVPRGVQPTPEPEWVRVHRMTCPPTGPQARPVRTSAHVATAHAGSWARSDREAMFIVVSALQQRLTSPARLEQALSTMPRLPRRGLIRDVAREFSEGAQSLNELDFSALCRQYHLPAPVRQSRICDSDGSLRAIDARFRTSSGREIRVEIEGLHHLDPAQYVADVDRHNALAFSDPAITLRITTWHLRHDPAPFMGDLGWIIRHG